MAPTVEVDSSNLKRGHGDGISLTKIDYKGGRRPYVKFWWSYHDKSPRDFFVIIFDVKDKLWYEDNSYQTKQHGNHKGHGKIDLKNLYIKHGCKYTVRLVNIYDYDDVYAESKPFWYN